MSVFLCVSSPTNGFKHSISSLAAVKFSSIQLTARCVETKNMMVAQCPYCRASSPHQRLCSLALDDLVKSSNIHIQTYLPNKTILLKHIDHDRERGQ